MKQIGKQGIKQVQLLMLPLRGRIDTAKERICELKNSAKEFSQSTKHRNIIFIKKWRRNIEEHGE